MINTTGLLEPQKVHAEFLYNSLITNNIAWDASPMGTGKTYSAAAIIRQLNKPFVIVCPKLVIPVWERVLQSFGLTAQFLIGYEKLCRGNTKWLKYRKPKKDKNGDKEEKFLCQVLKIPNDWFIVCDEFHKCKGINSLNAGFLMALKRQNYKFLLLSATAATSPLDLRAFGYACDLHNGEMRSFKNFAVQCGASWLGKWGALTFDGNDEKARMKMKSVHHYLFDEKKLASRMTREQFGDIFSECQISVEAYDMGVNSNKIQGVYDEMEYELGQLEERCENYSGHVLAIITKARRQVELLKVPSIVEMSTDLYEEDKSPVIFVNYTDTINAILERLTKEYSMDLIGQIHGGHSYKNRLQDVEDFKYDRKRFIVANLAAGGIAINLHDEINGDYARSSIISPSFSAINVLQSMGRTDRAKAKTPTYQKFLYASRTIEDSVCRKFQSKKDNIDLLNDGDLLPDGRIFDFVKGMSI